MLRKWFPIVLVAGAAILGLVGEAEAQTRPARPGLPVPLPIDPLGLNKPNGGIGGGTQQSPIKALIEMLTNTDDAIALATAIPSVQDPVGGSCWKSAGGISAVVKAHPDLLTGKVAADLEALRLVHIALNQICANPNCGQMWNDLQNAQAALQPVQLPLSLTSICAKIPVIGTSAAQSAPPVVAPAAPAVAPVPATSPPQQ